MFTADDLRAEGFVGFDRLLSLDVAASRVPTKPGVYVVLRESDDPPLFVATSPMGVRKGRLPAPVETLAARWVDGCRVVYIGMTTRPLADRLDEFRAMGEGGKNHYGGRYLLQLADAAELVVCWRATSDHEDAEEVEGDMLVAFKATYGSYPFANIRGPKRKRPNG